MWIFEIDLTFCLSRTEVEDSKEETCMEEDEENNSTASYIEAVAHDHFYQYTYDQLTEQNRVNIYISCKQLIILMYMSTLFSSMCYTYVLLNLILIYTAYYQSKTLVQNFTLINYNTYNKYMYMIYMCVCNFHICVLCILIYSILSFISSMYLCDPFL